MDPYELALSKWAITYNAYARLFNSGRLWEFYGPLIQEVRHTGEIPEWMGIDLLRGLAFCMYRDYDHSYGPETLLEQYPEFELVVDAIRNHPDARPEDLPPLRSL